MTVDDAIDQIMDHVQAGRLDQAEHVCQQVLQAVPDEHRALRLAGAICHKTGRSAEAEPLLRRAVELNPNNVEYRENLCVVLLALRRWDDAVSTARGIVDTTPHYAPAWNSLGLAFKEQRKFDEAEAAYRQALQVNPHFPQALNNLANLLRTLGRLDEAESICRSTLQAMPTFAEMEVNLGATLHEGQKYEEAIAAFSRALQLKPTLAQAAFNRGASEEAIGLLSDAEASYRLALDLQPSMGIARNNLGVVYKLQGRLSAASDCFRQCLDQKPDYMVAHTNVLLTMQCLSGVEPAAILAEHREWNARHAEPFKSECPTRLKVRNSGSPLRVGFVSPDLGTHPVGRFLIAPFEKLDTSRIETVCYSDRQYPDGVTARFESAATLWRETRRLTDAQLAARIREDEIDVLIDLTGHTGHHRLLVFARKPAPVQASWIGYPGTTGLEAIDWLIADPVLIPTDSERDYSENIARLPHCHICIEPPSFAPDITAPPCSTGSPATFASFNKLDKTTPEVLSAWAAILKQVPGSRLVMRNKGLDDLTTADRFRSAFVEEGIEAARIELHGWTSHASLLEHLLDVDIALDTFPFSGGATSADALWMGVPVITLTGKTFAARQTASMLTAIGMTDTIATSIDDYIAVAVALAGHPERIAEIRSTLRPAFRDSPLFDANGFAADFTELVCSLCRESPDQVKR